MPFIVPVWSYKTFFFNQICDAFDHFQSVKGAFHYIHGLLFDWSLKQAKSTEAITALALYFYNRPFIITNGPWYEFSRRLLLRQSNTGTSVHIFRLWQVGLKCFFKDKIHFNESLWGNL